MKDKTVAAILAFIFGVFGVHRFYLGQTMWGVLSIIFFWTGIPALIGILDSILFLAMDNDAFDYKYNWKQMDSTYRNLNSDLERKRYEKRRRSERTDRVREREFQREYQRKTPPPLKTVKKTSSQPLKNPYRDSGIQKFRDFDFDGAIDDFHKALEINNKDVAVHFNLACAYSITECKEDAFHHLEKAVAYGFNNEKKIKEHDALAFLRIQPEYEAFAKNGYQMESQKIEDLQKNQKESGNLLEQLQKLGELRDKGLLTEAEFDNQKKRLLS